MAFVDQHTDETVECSLKVPADKAPSQQSPLKRSAPQGLPKECYSSSILDEWHRDHQKEPYVTTEKPVFPEDLDFSKCIASLYNTPDQAGPDVDVPV